MANKIIVKNSSTESAVPTTGQLDLGELAVNTHDGKLFMKKDAGDSNGETVIEIGEIGSSVAELNDLTDVSISLPADGHILSYNNTSGFWENEALDTSTLVVGPGTATDNAIPRFDTTTGKLLQNSSATISDLGDLNVTTSDTANGAVLQTWTAQNGRTGQLLQPNSSSGPFIFSTANSWRFNVDSITRLSLGATGTISLTPATDVNITGGLVATGSISGSNLSGTNTGDQDLSSLTTGAASSTDNAIARFDSTTGKLLQNSSVTIANDGDIDIAASGATITWDGGETSIREESSAMVLFATTNILCSSDIAPETNDQVALGTSSLGWGDLYLASGARIDFNNNDVRITHSTNKLEFTGATGGYEFDDDITVRSGSNANLGSSFRSFDELYLAEDGIINFNNGFITITEISDSLEFGGASGGYDFDASGNSPVITVNGGTPVRVAGKESMWIPVTQMTPAVTNGPEAVTVETGADDVNYEAYNFDSGTDEYLWFTFAFPKSWNQSTITFQAFWLTSVTSGAVEWNLSAFALDNDDPIDTVLGTEVEVSDTAPSTANRLAVAAESSAMTIAGSPQEDEMCMFRIRRDADNDSLLADASLIGIKLFYTTNEPNDN